MAKFQLLARRQDNEEMLIDEVMTRAMQQHDVPGVMAIERASYAFPWSEKIIRDCVRVGFRCWVITQLTEVAGFAIASLSNGEYHILNLCIAPWARRLGYARRMLTVLLSEARLAKANYATLEVRVSNVWAQSLYQSFGFSELERRESYYRGVYDGKGGVKTKEGREDAFIYRIDI